MNYDLVGPVLALGLSAIGSSIGCGIAGIASYGAMSRVEEGHTRFLGLAAMPSTQIFYGFILMLRMSMLIAAGTLSPLSAIGIGLASGTAIMISAIAQGQVAAAGILAVSKQPSLFGKCLVTLGIIESFALFAFVFVLLIM